MLKAHRDKIVYKHKISYCHAAVYLSTPIHSSVIHSDRNGTTSLSPYPGQSVTAHHKLYKFGDTSVNYPSIMWTFVVCAVLACALQQVSAANTAQESGTLLFDFLHHVMFITFITSHFIVILFTSSLKVL